MISPMKADIISISDKQAAIEYGEVLPVLIIIHKRIIRYCGAFVLFFAAFAAIMWAGSLRTPMPAFSPEGERHPVVVLDAGHGGEDGGAVSSDGVKESNINLQIAKETEQILRFFGVRTVMIRREDVMVGDSTLPTMRQRKVSDIHHRAEMTNGLPDAVLLSIHQNSLPSSTVTHGAQAFWNESAAEWAEITQKLLNSCINERPKEPRKIPSNIYLMNHTAAPAVLVECGFLSNEEETALLQTLPHQMKIAAALTAGYLQWAGEGVT